jgi:alkylation response protein AidB-like acyl-CoA dehydrogenase
MSTLEHLLAAVRELEPMVRRHAAEAEGARRLSAPVVEALRAAGLYRMWRPKALGGLEVDPITAFRVIEELSRIDSAAGWNLQSSTVADTLGAWLPEAGATEVFGDPRTILAGAFFPPRTAVAVNGGYRVTGRTTFVSGASEADWVGGLAHVLDGGEPRLGPDGEPFTLLTLLPRAEVEVIDNWDTLGMCGTGSHDVAVTDVIVPSRRAVPWVPLETRSPAYAGPLYRLAVWPIVGALAVPSLGVARAAIDGLVALAQKTPAYTKTTLRNRPIVQTELARAEAALGAARAYLYGATEEAWAEAVAGRPIGAAHKAKIQLAATNAAQAAAQAVDLVHAAVGATGIRREQPFQRYFRDAHVLTQHAYVSPSRYESVGRLILGLDPEWGFFGF